MDLGKRVKEESEEMDNIYLQWEYRDPVICLGEKAEDLWDTAVRCRGCRR